MADTLDTMVLVDDELLILNALRRVIGGSIEFRNFQLYTYTNPHEAWEAIRTKSVTPAIIVSDYMMSGMNGGELLRRVSEVSPSTYRVLSSGSHTADDIGQGIVHYELPKPLSTLDIDNMGADFRQFRAKSQTQTNGGQY